jgi:hypothetical protein
MATTQGKELWRARVERLLATDMSVSEWCEANRVSESAAYRWLGVFADTEPELFGGAQNIADRDRNAWLVRTRENMRGLSAPIVPIGKDEPASREFVRIDVASLAAQPELAPARPAPTITVSIGAAVVSVPAGSAPADVACVLGAVSRL